MQAIRDLVGQQLEKTLATLHATAADASIAEAVATAGETIARAMLSGHKLLVAGNGGSAADAQHLVAELVARLTVDRPALRAIALTTDSSILTAIGNDFGYDQIYERQMLGLGQKGDVFLAISTSGNSKNLIRALEAARSIGVTTVGYTGNGGGAMAALCGINVIIPSKTTMHIQEAHLALEHTLCMIIEECYFGTDFANAPKILSE